MGDSAFAAELKSTLKALSVSQTRVKALCNLALKHSREYKVVVHEIEKHIARSPAENRLAGVNGLTIKFIRVSISYIRAVSWVKYAG